MNHTVKLTLHRVALPAILISGLLNFALSAEPPATPAPAPVDAATHAAHVAAGAMPADTNKGDPALAQQITQLQAKVKQLEAALAKSTQQRPATTATMPGMSRSSAATTPMAGMGGPPSGAMKPASGTNGRNMMAMMEKMMGMMDKMMSMGGNAPATGAPMSGSGGGMGMMDMDDSMEMGGMGGMGGSAMPSGSPMGTQSTSGGMGMGMDKMEMTEMMGMGSMGGGAMPQSALPGFPGASHLYHIGSTGFFLDHPQHISLTTEQQAELNKAKEQALMAKNTADRAIQQAEQELWTLTGADQPDAAKIEEKIRGVGKLRGDERLSFIRAVGEASKVLSDDQRKVLTGFAPPAPAAAPMSGGMKDM